MRISGCDTKSHNLIVRLLIEPAIPLAVLYGTLWGKCADCGGIPRPVCETGQWADLPAACGEVYCRRKAPVTV